MSKRFFFMAIFTLMSLFFTCAIFAKEIRVLVGCPCFGTKVSFDKVLAQLTQEIYPTTVVEYKVFKYDRVQDKKRLLNSFVKIALERNFDYLFIVDQHVKVDKKTLERLLAHNKDIVGEVCWDTSTGTPIPNVWVHNDRQRYSKDPFENLSLEVEAKRTAEFFDMLKTAGIYEVGGVEGCVLISSKVLRAGLNFKKIYNLTFNSNPFVSFCLRAQALGFGLFVDTNLPAQEIQKKQPTVTLSMVVRNEANRYLKDVLNEVKNYINAAVIIDDASTDNTVEICREILHAIPLKIIVNKVPLWETDETVLRKLQWEETIKTDPEWILNLDADEVPEKRFRQDIVRLINCSGVDAYSFRLFDFWDEEHYRSDGLWFAHTRDWMFLARYKPNIEYRWNAQKLHCGRWPRTVCEFQSVQTNLRVKHFGWAKPDDRMRKYVRYKKCDPLGIYGSNVQYESILDKNPHLERWLEDEQQDLYQARFFTTADEKQHFFDLTWLLPDAWWSRCYEYVWASHFIKESDTVLDAACGIEHPFKYFLAKNCRTVYACDIDQRLLQKEYVITQTASSFLLDEKAIRDVIKLYDKINVGCFDLTKLPYKSRLFDKIFCLSVLEHLDIMALEKTIKEFSRVLKDDGLIVLTFDFPVINLESFQPLVNRCGLQIKGSANFIKPSNALYSPSYNLYCFRMVLEKRLMM